MASRLVKSIFTVLLLTTCVAIEASGYRAQILPDMMQHLESARTCANKGDFGNAVAHTDIILLNRDLKVYVEPMHGGREMDSLCQQALGGAISMWEEALGNQVRFVEDNDELRADIIVRFDSEVLSSNGQEVGGNVSWTRSIVNEGAGPKGVIKAQIKVRTRLPGGGNMNFEQMRHVACHELGHVLGLGDSPRIGDIMGPLDLRKPALNLSIDEIQALRDVRETAAEVRREALQKVLLSLRLV